MDAPATRGRTGLLLAALAVGLVAVPLGLAWAMGWFTPPLERARAAYAAGDWAATEVAARRQLGRVPADSEATRLIARARARLGQAGEAPSLLRAFAPENWEAEELLLIGRDLIESGRIVPGWAAIDGAVKLDPRHREAIEALSGLAGRAASLGPAVQQADLLMAIPSGRALAEVVDALLEEGPAKPLAEFDPLLNRLARLDRASLSRLDSADAARKLLARQWLRLGRPAEARARLEQVSNRANDPETNWLLSRVHLVEGRAEEAAAALARAGSQGDDDPMAHEPSAYAGAQSCQECHDAIHAVQQNGPHGRTITWGEGKARVPLPRGEITDPHDPTVRHVFRREGDRIEVEARTADQTFRGIVEYVMGSGHHGQTMLARDQSGTYRSLRMSYYTGGDAWDITSGYDPHPNDPAEFLGMALAPSSFTTCLNCHTTRFESERDRSGPEAADRGIGCEKCHGPAQNHILAVNQGFTQLAIARPKIATPAQRLALCNTCHGSDGKIPPSDPRFLRFQTTTLPYSRCMTESGGKFDCVSCHNPHTKLATDPAHYEARCLACHGPNAPVTDASLRLEAVAASRCKTNARTDCVTCHMPKAVNVIPFTSFTDHHIRVHKELTGADVGGAGR